jgi:hypothetical protein
MLGGLAGAAPVGGQRTRYYVLQRYYLKNGTQPERIHGFFSRHALPALGRVHTGPVLVLESVIAEHMPQVAMLVGYRSLTEYELVQRRVMQDPAMLKAWEAWELAPEQPFESQSNTLLQATTYSSEMVASEQPQPRIFELRVYHSPSWNHLLALHERFAGPEIRIFARCGIHPVLYSSGLFGEHLPNLTYLIPFANLAEREKAWAKFGQDEEWKRVRRESVEKHGQVSSVAQMALYRATAYSPFR